MAHRHISTEHILPGVLHDAKGVAAELLLDEGIEYRLVRRMLLQEFGGYADSG